MSAMGQLAGEAAQQPAGSLDGRSLADRDPAHIDRMLPFLDWLYHHYFRVKTDGWEHVPAQGPMLIVGSHNGGLAAPDTLMMTYDWLRRFGSQRPAYALMDPRIWRVLPTLGRMGSWVGCLRADSPAGVRALRQGFPLLVYPGGARDVFRPRRLRHRICFFGQKGFIKLALREEVPIVPAISYGAHDTLWVLEDFYEIADTWRRQQTWDWPLGIDPGTLPLYLGLPWGITLGPWPHLPLPVPLHTRVCPPITFPRYGLAAAQDGDYVDACYNQVLETMQQSLDQLFALYE
jgi:1-acyl-sn-glycerol-3-phosphate acyltransferase